MTLEISAARSLAHLADDLWNIAGTGIAYFSADGRNQWADNVLVCPKALLAYGISVDDVIGAIRHQVICSRKTIGSLPLVVERCLRNGDLILCDEKIERCDIIKLRESGSAATVTVRLNNDDELEVIKRCAGDGIDGNGRPWLRQQIQFFEACSEDSAIAELFVAPNDWKEEPAETIVSFPYVPGNSLAELTLRGAGHTFIMSTLRELISRLAASVWRRGVQQAPSGLLKKIHLDRMARRIKIAAQYHHELRELLSLKEIVINDETLINFPQLLDRLDCASLDARWSPFDISFVHGDLNVYNILCSRDVLAFGEKVVLLDPRGTRLQSTSREGIGVEPGDRAYDLGKLKFSFSGFVAIRAGLLELASTAPGCYSLAAKCVSPSIQALESCDKQFLSTIERIPGIAEPLGNHWRERTLLAEASNFISDTACCFGRDTPAEVIPLYLRGVQLLNQVHDQCVMQVPAQQIRQDKSREQKSIPIPRGIEAPIFGLQKIRHQLRANVTTPAWDVIEILTKEESLETTHSLIQSLKGAIIPHDTTIVESRQHGHWPFKLPVVFLHSFSSRTGALNSLAKGIRSTDRLLHVEGVDVDHPDQLRILSILSAGASSRNAIFARNGDKLLMPGPYNVSSLQLVLQQSYQLPARPGRWICNNDGVFLLSRSIESRFNRFALLGGKIEQSHWNGESAWNVHQVVHTNPDSNGVSLVSTLKELPGKFLIPYAATFNFGIYFMPHPMAKALSQVDLVDTDLDLVNDFIMMQCLGREEWLNFARSTHRGENSWRIWDELRSLIESFGDTEFLCGGNQALFVHIGSSQEYLHFLEAAEIDPLLKPFVHMPNILALSDTANWLPANA